MTTNKSKYDKRKKKAQHHKVLAKQSELIASDQLARPKKYSTIAKVITFNKSAVYSITRMRQVGNATQTGTIGTGFLCAPNRFLTCAHVISNKQDSHAFAHHQDGDTYYLLSKDEKGNKHWHILKPKMNNDMWVYPDFDMAILNLNDDFYYQKKKVVQNKNRYIPLCARDNVLASDVGVIGYPLEKDNNGNDKGVYIDQGTKEIRTENIRMRADTGVVNASYQDIEDKNVSKYEFTMAFNPGNSGGPILNQDGCAVAIVHGYKAFPIKVIEEKFIRTRPDGSKENISAPSTIRATYSIGISSDNFLKLAEKHQLLTC